MEIEKYIRKIESKVHLNHVSDLNSDQTYDIIIPVYNGLDAVKECLESILEHTPKSNTIHIYDDASTDPKIKPWLIGIGQQHKHIKLHFNESNLGYLKNINQAFKDTNKDVVVLNSDTVVTKNWLTEMAFIANEPTVGIVCPLSDNATILSLHEQLCDDYPHLKFFTGHWYPIPTAVGSCMLIKRQIIDQFGGFDPYFDPGYGEECDYSFTLRMNGIDIACACAAFVYHKGSASFEDSSLPLKESHQHLLDIRWPKYSSEVKSFAENNPIHLIEEYLFSQQEKKLKTVLHVIHGIDFKGGVELFTKQLIDELSSQFNHVIWVPSATTMPNQTVRHEIKSDHVRVCYFQFLAHSSNSQIGRLSADLNNEKLDQLFTQIALYNQPELVHFHSMVGLGTVMLPLICAELKIPYLLSCHDHFGICHNYELTTGFGTSLAYCQKQQCLPSDKDCINCLQDSSRFTSVSTEQFISTRNQYWDQIFIHAKSVFTPSQYLKELLSKRFKGIKSKTHVVEPVFTLKPKSAAHTNNNKQPTVAFLGNFSIPKGAKTFLQAHQQLSNYDIHWKIIGGVDAVLNNLVKPLDIEVTGSYSRDELEGHFKNVDVIVLASVFPETYSITLTEAWNHHCLVIAPNLGAINERVMHKKNGFIFDSNDSSSLAKTIKLALFDEPETSAKIRNFLSNKYPEIHEPHAVFKAIYNQESIEPGMIKPERSVNAIKHSLDKPSPSAADLMSDWLNAPMTLEGLNDWEDPIKTVIVILGKKPDLIQLTRQSIESFAASCEIIINPSDSEVKRIINENSICLINAGHLFNDNFGNWTQTFMESKYSIGLADYALHNQNSKQYAPQFIGKFDPFRLLRRIHHIGCVLMKPKMKPLVEESDLEGLLEGKKTISNFLSDTILKDGLDGIQYFPHLSYYHHDQLWARDWKNNRNTPCIKPLYSTQSISIAIVSTGKNTELSHLINTLLNQKHLDVLSIHVFIDQTNTISETEKVFYHPIDHCCSSSAITQVMNKQSADVLFFTHDNVGIVHEDALFQLVQYLGWFEVGGISPTFPVSSAPHSLFGNKAGKGNYMFGYGPLWDQRFDAKNYPIMNEFLDEDCWVISSSCWQQLGGLCDDEIQFHQSEMLSIKIAQLGFKVALMPTHGFLKKGLPTHYSLMKKGDLAKERDALFANFASLLKRPVYVSRSLNSQDTLELDSNFGTFKTPKKLPRILAYANDSRASGYYRVKSPLSALVASNQISSHFLPEQRENKTPTVCELSKQQPNILLLHNFFSDVQLSALKTYRQMMDIPIVFSIDDLVTDLPEYNQLRKSNPKHMFERFKFALKHVDRLIVSTDFLAQQYKDLHDDIIVVKNMISRSLWPVRNKSDNHKIRIGWAGAGQHSADIDWLTEVVNKTSEYVDWVFYGDKPNAVDLNSVEFHAPTPLGQYHSYLSSLQLDIAIAPLVSNDFNFAKSNLKLLEYGAIGAAVISSDIVPYHSSPALKLENKPKLWIDHIIHLATHSEARIKLAQNMQNWVQKNYYLEDHLDSWSSALFLD